MTPAAAPGIGGGMIGDLDDLTLNLEYWRIVQRLRQTPLPQIDRDLLLAEMEEAYWRAARVPQKRPALVRCEEAPELPRRNADKIKGLKARRGAITDPDFCCLPLSPVFAPDTGCAWLGQLCLSI